LAEVYGWVERHAAVVGVPDQCHVRPWSTVIRFPTSEGDLWFKANHEPLRHEAALVALLAARRPKDVPPLVAADESRGWLLMRDAGERLRDVVSRTRDLSCWLEILPAYAELQLAAAPDAAAFVDRGVPDLRLVRLPAAFERLVDEHPLLTEGERSQLRRTGVSVLCDAVAATGVVETIEHDDLHDGQVYVRDGHYLLLDWGDACVSHPFFTLAVTLRGFLAWGLDDIQGSVEVAPYRDAYLEPFTTHAARQELVDAAEAAMQLGWAVRAINCTYGEAEPAETRTHLRMFLDGRP